MARKITQSLYNDEIISDVKNFITSLLDPATEGVGSNSGLMQLYEKDESDLYYVPTDYSHYVSAGAGIKHLYYSSRKLVHEINQNFLGKTSYGFNLLTIASTVAAMNSPEVIEFMDRNKYKVEFPKPVIVVDRSDRLYTFSDIINEDEILNKMWENTLDAIVKTDAVKYFIDAAQFLFKRNLYDTIFMFNKAMNHMASDIRDASGDYDETKLGSKYYTYRATGEGSGKRLHDFYDELFEAGVDPIPFIVSEFTSLDWAAMSKDPKVRESNDLYCYFGVFKSSDKDAYHMGFYPLLQYLRCATSEDIGGSVPYYDATYSKYETTTEHKELSRKKLRLMTIEQQPICLSPFMEHIENISYVFESLGYHNEGSVESGTSSASKPFILLKRPVKMYGEQQRIISKTRKSPDEYQEYYTDYFGRHLTCMETLLDLFDVYDDILSGDYKKSWMMYWLQEIMTTIYLAHVSIDESTDTMLSFIERHPSLRNIECLPTIMYSKHLIDLVDHKIRGDIKDSDSPQNRKNKIARNASSFMMNNGFFKGKNTDQFDYIHNMIALFAYEYDAGGLTENMTAYTFFVTTADLRLEKYHELQRVKETREVDDEEKYMTVHMNPKLFAKLYSIAISPILSCKDDLPNINSLIRASDFVKGVDIKSYINPTIDMEIERNRIQDENNLIAMCMVYEFVDKDGLVE